MKAKLTEKTYYLITRPDTSLSVENHQDRTFILRGKQVYGYSIFTTSSLDGDPHWPITKENILKVGEAILDDEVKKLKSPSKEESETVWQRLLREWWSKA